MSKLFKIELIKLKSSLAFKITILVCIFLCVSNVALYGVMANVDLVEGAEELFGSINGYGIFLTAVKDSSDCLMLATIVMCILIGGDFSGRTLQAQITAGFSRNKVVIARVLSSIVVLFIFCFFYVVVLTAGTTLLCGFGHEFNAGVLGEMILSFVMSFFMSTALLTMYLLIIFMFKSVGPSIGVCMPLMLLGTSVLSIVAAVSDTFNKIYMFTPLGQLSAIGDNTLEALDYVKFFSVGIVFGAVMVAIISAIFKKAELK